MAFLKYKKLVYCEALLTRPINAIYLHKDDIEHIDNISDNYAILYSEQLHNKVGDI